MDYLRWAVKNLTNIKPEVKLAIEHEILNRESELVILDTFYTQEAEDAGVLGQEHLWCWIDTYREIAIQMGLLIK